MLLAARRNFGPSDRIRRPHVQPQIQTMPHTPGAPSSPRPTCEGLIPGRRPGSGSLAIARRPVDSG